MGRITIAKDLASNANLPLHTTYRVLLSFAAAIYVPPQLIYVMELALVKETVYSVRRRYVQSGVAIEKYEIRVVGAASKQKASNSLNTRNNGVTKVVA